MLVSNCCLFLEVKNSCQYIKVVCFQKLDQHLPTEKEDYKYPSMVSRFYIEMSSMPQDASSHIIIVCNIQFEVLIDVITQLLELHHMSKTSSIVDAQAQGAPDISTYASSTILVDSMAGDVDLLERTSSNIDEAQGVNQEENFFILTKRYHTMFDKNNTFSQTLLLQFFYILHLIVATNVNPIGGVVDWQMSSLYMISYCRNKIAWTRQGHAQCQHTRSCSSYLA